MTPNARLDALVDDCVTRALAGEASLERLVCLALTGRPPRNRDDAWPKRAREVWSLAVSRYTTAARAASAEQDGPAISLEQAWSAFEELAPDPAQWWIVPRATWPVIARQLRAGSRTAHYYLHDVQGWRLSGAPRARVIVVAPCLSCGVPVPPQELHDRRCPICA